MHNTNRVVGQDVQDGLGRTRVLESLYRAAGAKVVEGITLVGNRHADRADLAGDTTEAGLEERHQGTTRGVVVGPEQHHAALQWFERSAEVLLPGAAGNRNRQQSMLDAGVYSLLAFHEIDRLVTALKQRRESVERHVSNFDPAGPTLGIR